MAGVLSLLLEFCVLLSKSRSLRSCKVPLFSNLQTYDNDEARNIRTIHSIDNTTVDRYAPRFFVFFFRRETRKSGSQQNPIKAGALRGDSNAKPKAIENPKLWILEVYHPSMHNMRIHRHQQRNLTIPKHPSAIAGVANPRRKQDWYTDG